MALTISELCKLTEPQMIPRTGAHGLKNRVKWVVSTEHLEPRDWLRGGEFLLMCGWNLRPSRSLMHRFIDHLHTSNIAGLGFGVGFKFERIPDQLLERANALGFPVCEVPFELAFAQISRRATEKIYEERHTMSGTHSQMSSATLNDVFKGHFNLDDIAVHISHTLISNTYFMCERRGVIARAVRNPSERLPEIYPESRTSRHCLGSVQLELHRDEKTLSKTDTIFLNEMLLAARILLFKEQSVSTERERLTADLINEIAEKDLPPGLLVQRLSAFGLDTMADYASLVIKRPDPKHLIELKQARVFISTLPELALSLEREDKVEALWMPKSAQQVEKVFDEACALSPNLGIGMSEVGPAIELSKFIHQARSVAERGQQSIYGRSETSIEELLTTANSVSALEYVASMLPKSTSIGSFSDIEALLDQGFNINGTAKKLGIHRHTLRSKIERFIDVTGLDIRDPEIRQKAWLAIKLERIHAKKQQA